MRTTFWQWFNYNFRLRAEDESPSAATTRRIIGMATVGPAVTAYVFVLGDVSPATLPTLMDAAAGALTGLAISWLPGCRGRGMLVGVVALFLAYLLRDVLRVPDVEPEKLVTTMAFVAGAVAVCVHDLVKYPRRPKLTAVRSAWRAQDGIIALEACSSCDKPVCVAPTREEEKALSVVDSQAGTPLDRPVEPASAGGALWPLLVGTTAGFAVSALVIQSPPSRGRRGRSPRPTAD